MVLAGSRRRKASSRNASSRKTHRVRSSRGGRRSRIRRGGSVPPRMVIKGIFKNQPRHIAK